MSPSSTPIQPSNPFTAVSAKTAPSLRSDPQLFITSEINSNKNPQKDSSFSSQARGQQVTLFVPGRIQNGADVPQVNPKDLLAHANVDYSPKAASDDLGTVTSQPVV